MKIKVFVALFRTNTGRKLYLLPMSYIPDCLLATVVLTFSLLLTAVLKSKMTFSSSLCRIEADVKPRIKASLAMQSLCCSAVTALNSQYFACVLSSSTLDSAIVSLGL